MKLHTHFDLVVLRRCFALICFHLLSGAISAQVNTFFDVIPDLGGMDDQGQGMVVLADSQYIYVMGDLIDDSTVPGDTAIRPFFIRLGYDGQLHAKNILNDRPDDGEFRLTTRPAFLVDTSVWIYIDRLDSIEEYHACMMELDRMTGNIIRYRYYPHPPAVANNHTGRYTSLDTNKNIITYHYLGHERQIFLRVIDSIFSITHEALVEENERSNSPRYIEADTDTTFTLIGQSSGSRVGISKWFEKNFFYARVNHQGNMLDFKLAPGILHNILGFTSANSYTVLRHTNGSWIFSGNVVELLEPTGLNYYTIPLTICVSPQFDTLRWMTYFGEQAYEELQFYTLSVARHAAGGDGFVVLGRNHQQTERTSMLVKMNYEGDVQWRRHYIPVGFEPDQLIWSNMDDITVTPYNTYVMTGTFFDLERFIRRPWVLHIDSMGCLIPGCGQTVSTMEEPSPTAKYFSFHPNPVSDYLALAYHGPDLPHQDFSLFFYSTSGQMIKTMAVSPFTGGQYIVNLRDMPAGMYYMHITSKTNPYSQTEMITKF